MEFTFRPVTPGDHARLEQIAAEGDFRDCESNYLSFIADVGRLLCSTIDDEIVAFAGIIPVGDVAMVTDLFVANAARGLGLGGRLLGELLDGRPRRMTFSAQHLAALAAYRRQGMEPRGRLLYLSGFALGGGSPAVPSAWMHGRDDVVDHFATHGATVTANAVFTADDREIEVLRLDAPNAIDECHQLLRTFHAGTVVNMCVPERHPLAAWLMAHDFVVGDHDVLCTTDGVALPPTLAVLHPGLA